LKAIREKNKITYKGKPINIMADFSTEPINARRVWSKVFQAMNENNFSSKLSFKID
jgi:hypothetical protein